MEVRFIQEKHERVSRMLMYALTLGTDPDGWHALAVVAEARLTVPERTRLLVATIGSLPLDTALEAVGAIQDVAGGGMPLAPLLDVVNDATWWADHASLEERKACLAAAYASLQLRDRQEFLAAACRRAA